MYSTFISRRKVAASVAAAALSALGGLSASGSVARANPLTPTSPTVTLGATTFSTNGAFSLAQQPLTIASPDAVDECTTTAGISVTSHPGHVSGFAQATCDDSYTADGKLVLQGYDEPDKQYLTLGSHTLSAKSGIANQVQYWGTFEAACGDGQTVRVHVTMTYTTPNGVGDDEDYSEPETCS